MEKGGTNLAQLSVYSRTAEIAFLLHCQTLGDLSYNCYKYQWCLEDDKTFEKQKLVLLHAETCFDLASSCAISVL